MKGHFNSNELPASYLLKNLTDFCFKGTYTIYNSTDNLVKKKKKCHDKNCIENHGNNDHKHGNSTNSKNGSSLTVKSEAKSYSQKVINKEIKMKKKDDKKNKCYTEEYDYNRVEQGGEEDSDNDEDEEDEEEFSSNNVRYVKEEEGGQEEREKSREDRNNNGNDSDNTDDETEGHLLFAYSVRRKRIKKEIEINEEHSSEGVAADRVHLMKGTTIGASDR